MQGDLTQADGHAERKAALDMVHRHSPGSTRRLTLGADKGYDAGGFVRDLRQAARRSIDWGALPAAQISYRVAVDLDGNGLAVDQGGALELSPVRTLRRDTDDLNGDGLTDAQLVWIEGDEVRVLANNLIPPGAQGNPQGLWFEQAGLGLRVTLRTEHTSGPRDAPVRVVLTEAITPRN